MNTIGTFLARETRLPSPPAIAIRILEAVKDEKNSASSLARIVSSDPALAARVLRIVNSSYYGLPSRVNDVQTAITILGLQVLKNIALSFVIVRNLRGMSEGGFDFNLFWKRSVTAAVASGIVSGLQSGRQTDMFAAALLCDIGVVIMYQCRPNDYLTVLDTKRVTGQPIHVVEPQVFGFDHQELGSEVLKQWGLSDSISVPLRHHHDPASCPAEHAAEARNLYVSDRLSSIYHGGNSATKVQHLKGFLAREYGASDQQIEALIDTVAERTVELLSYFDIDPGQMKPYSQILQEANEELGKLNLSYGQLLMELKQAKEQSERLALELGEANKHLRRLASEDGLTGLYNYRYLQEFLQREVERVGRYGGCLSLILFDLDEFKSINDAHGHQTGDLVLQRVSGLFRASARSSDVVARYGGDEFALVAPQTDLRGAAAVAERVRKAIASLVIPVNGTLLSVTVSVGVTTWAPGETMLKATEVIDAADRALYEAKRGGRNRISIATGESDPGTSPNTR